MQLVAADVALRDEDKAERYEVLHDDHCAGMQTLMVGTSELSLSSNPFLVEMR